ncbi:MAG: hypothetical protein AAGG44_08345 [Planctomycetota bacterium]
MSGEVNPFLRRPCAGHLSATEVTACFGVRGDGSLRAVTHRCLSLLVLIGCGVGVAPSLGAQESSDHAVLGEPKLAKLGEPKLDTRRPIRVERNLTYREIDGQEVRADVVRPAWESTELWPTILGLPATQ